MPKITPDGGGIIHIPSVYKTEIIHDEGDTITKATLYAETTGSGSITYYLSANNGTNWEEVTSGTEHIFTNTGTQLKFIAVGYDIELNRYKISLEVE